MAEVPGCGLRLQSGLAGWTGDVRCALPLPLANESVAAVVLQHVEARGAEADALVQECARVLVPGGRLVLYALHPLSPWRWRWAGPAARPTDPLQIGRASGREGVGQTGSISLVAVNHN